MMMPVKEVMSCMEGCLEMEMAQVVKPLGVTLYSVDRKPGVLRVMLDRRGGVDLDHLEEASHLLSAFLDASDPLHGNPYVLEVSSPGAERKISNPSQAECAVGLLVSVEFRGHPIDDSAGRDAGAEKKTIYGDSKDAHGKDKNTVGKGVGSKGAAGKDGASKIYGRLLSVEENDIIVELNGPSSQKAAGSVDDANSEVDEARTIRIALDDDVVVRTVLEWGTRRISGEK